MNTGKRFEENFKKSVPKYCLLQRLNDPPQSFIKDSGARFAPKNPCDFFCFDSTSHILYCLELKSTGYKSMAFEDINEENPKPKMIHKYQIVALRSFKDFENVESGFIFNFRTDETNLQRSYYQRIKDFLAMTKEIGKHSFNELDLLTHHAIVIHGEKKRTNYVWDVDELFQSIALSKK